jgi:two-component sensor histidine kinase
MTRSSHLRTPTGVASPGGIVDAPDPDVLVREINHRVKNNFQIILSLMNLRKRMVPPERGEDIRFIEEHVQSMSVAFRLVYATGSMIDVPLSELITEVLSGLRQIASLGEDQLRVDAEAARASIGLDHAIALALYLAVLLPPYLDEALASGGTVTVTIAVSTVANLLTLSVERSWIRPVALDLLRTRLMRAYAAQLKAENVSATKCGAERLHFVLETPTATPPASFAG